MTASEPSRLQLGAWAESPGSMKKKLLALLLGVVFALALVEVASRVLVRATLSENERASLVLPFEQIPYRPHPYLNWENLPSRTTRDGERHNADGFRGPERPVAKAEGTYRIACLGGSTTYTQRVKEFETYPAQLEAFLVAQSPGRTIEVLNAGVKGYTTAESLMNLAFKVLDYEPDAIVVYHAVNDFYPRAYPGFRPDYLHCRVVWVGADLEKNTLLEALELSATFRLLRFRATDYAKRGGLYYWIYDPAIAQTSREDALAKSTTVGFEENLRAICRIAAGRGIACVIASQAQNLVSDFADKPSPVPIDQMNAAARRVAGEEGAFFVDSAANFPQDPGYFDKNDLVHMQPMGARELARRIGQGFIDHGILARPAKPPAIRRDDGAALPSLEPLESPLPEASRERIERGEIVYPSPYFLYALVPNAAASPGLGPHDATGRRTCATPPRDASSPPRTIVCLGGSATYGLGVTADEAWPSRLREKLRGRGLDRFVVHNGGVPGYTSAEVLAAAHFRDLPLGPELVVIGPGFEDALPRVLPGFRTDYAHARGTFRFGEPKFPDSWVSATLPEGDDLLGSGAPRRALRDGAKLENPPATPGAFALHRNLRTLVDLARARARKPRVMLTTLVAPEGHSALAAYAADWNRVVSAIAAETPVELVTLDLDPGVAFLPRSCQFTASAHDSIAAAIESAILAPR